MIRFAWTALCLLLSAPALRAEDGAYSIDRQWRILTRDRSLHDTAALGRVAERLGAHRFRRYFADAGAAPEYRLSAGSQKHYTFKLVLDSTWTPGDSGGWLYRIRLDAETFQNEAGLGPNEAFLRSAYLDEVLPDREPAHGERHLRLEPKSHSLYWKRNWIFAGSATAYARAGNPFSPELNPFWPGLWDAAGYATFAYGVFAGDGTALVTGALISGLAKFLFGSGNAAHLENYNRIVTSGYRIPARVAHDSLRKEPPAAALARRRPPKDSASRPLFHEPPARRPVTATDRVFVACMGAAFGLGGGVIYSRLVHAMGKPADSDVILKSFAGGLFLGVTFAVSL